jgi:hypothetical protein
LEAHTGVHCANGRVIDLNQDRIFQDGEVIGYVGRLPDSPINLIYPDVPEDVQQEVRAAVEAKYKGAAQQISSPVEIPDDALDDTDADDLD